MATTPNDRKWNRRDWWWVLGLTVAAGILRFAWLGHPNVIVFDETYFANFAHNYLTNTLFFDAEPPLGKFLIAAGIDLFGFNSFGWRVAPALLGTLTIPLFYVLAKQIFGGRVVPALAGLLALGEGFLLVESRVAVLDGMVVFFNMLLYVLFLASLQAKGRPAAYRWLVAAGVALGLAVSLKWITLAFLAPAGLLVLILKLARFKWVQRLFRVDSQTKIFSQLGIQPAAVLRIDQYLVWLMAVPAMLYAAIFSFHVPFDSTHGTWWSIHQNIYYYHENLKATHPYGSTPITWPLEIRPVAYYFNNAGPHGQWSAITALGNPLVWWGGILGVGWVVRQALRRLTLPMVLILAAIVANYAPWFLIHRVLFLYHYLGTLPWVILALAAALGASWRWKPRDPSWQLGAWILLTALGAWLGSLLGRSALGGSPSIGLGLGAALVAVPIVIFASHPTVNLRWGAKQAIVAVALCLLAFVFFLPIWTAMPLSPADYYRHMWLKSWI